ncbi:uncharacterized protein LOC126701205 [Quercus robur]|uniref:uncharacterized protein LOC126701205 n=1 Tax=Quercus robur TaxID=38942 RepID=UPI0021615AC3|nr:uncharacterized protein LOC126701205 [Quercus robur]
MDNEILKKGLGGAVPLIEEYVTMQEYYAYQLQQRENEGETLILGRRLRQQFLVDAYTCVEEYRLIWVRNHQLQLRSEVYFGIKDAVFRGDTTPSSIGKRVVLPSSFTRSPRYMIQNYQDAMSICRWARYPNLFITFTCNPKWPEIESFLSLIPAQRPEDRRDIIARVFKIKLDQLLRDLKHGKHFGKVIAVNYTVEWQKRGLPHAHILLYLYLDDKHPTPVDIDKIIYAKIPDKITNPGDYEVISQFMIHGPCDEDGYAIYRRRDDGKTVEKNGVMLDNRFVVPYNIDVYISASEACWRLFEFDNQYREPDVQRLSFHIENEQNVTFKDSDYLDNVLERPDITKTMFTEWMKANEMYDTTRNLTYCDFPTKWVWHRKQKEWRPRKPGQYIGRIFHAHPASGDCFYLRILLNVVKGARSFEEIRTIDHVVYPTYKAACYAHGLLDDDKEWDDAIKEASNWASRRQLRELFATLLLFCEVIDPHALWMANWELFSDDILYRQKHLLMYDNLHLIEEQIQNYALFEIEQILVKNGRSLKEFDGIKYPNVLTIRENNNRLLLEDGGLYFVYGHGGTGKTYLWKTLIACLHSQGKIVLAIASSGIAALLLPGGRTAHSKFQIPIIVTEESTCGIKQGTHAAELMTKVSLIIWDEAPMAHCGDFRQILPVIAKCHREDIVDASVNRSYLWSFCKVFVLTQNMRLQHPNADSNNFAEWILKLGNGELGEVDSQSNIVIPSGLLIDVGDDPIQSIVTATYPNLHSNYADGKYLEERSILAPTNDVVNEINDNIIDLLLQMRRHISVQIQFARL